MLRKPQMLFCFFLLFYARSGMGYVIKLTDDSKTMASPDTSFSFSVIVQKIAPAELKD